MASFPWQTLLSAIVALVTATAVVARYVLKVEASFADQRVVNAEMIATLRSMRGEVAANKELNEEQHNRLTDRIDYTHRQLALADDGR